MRKKELENLKGAAIKSAALAPSGATVPAAEMDVLRKKHEIGFGKLQKLSQIDFATSSRRNIHQKGSCCAGKHIPTNSQRHKST